MLRITHVQIENYRSIKSIEFRPKMLCGLVGPNNAGKSNILSALELLLGYRYPTENSLTEDDFYGRDQTLPLRISAEFEYRDEGGFLVPMRIEFGPDPARENELKLRYWGEGQAGRFPTREFRERFSFIRLDVNRGSRQQQPMNRWTLLGRLLLEINEELRGDEARMAQFEETMRTLRDDVLASVPGFETLVQVLREESARQLQRTVEDVNVEFSLHDPWNFYRTLQLVVQECGMTFRADQVGMGLQSSLTIAVLRAYAKIARQDRAVIAIEEPELFLHPLAQRQFYRLMRELAHPEDGSPPLQIFYTTHSGNFVDLERFDEVCVVRREQIDEGWTTTVRQAEINSLVEALHAAGFDDATEGSVRGRLRAAFDRGSTEGIFASLALMVEGPSEELSLPIYARQADFDLDAHNVAVVAAGGKGNIPLIHRVFEQLGIPIYVVFDGDRHKPAGERRGELNEQILALTGIDGDVFPETTVGERCTVWAEEFERTLREEVADYAALEQEAGDVLGGPGKGVRARYCALRLAERDEMPPSLDALVERLRELLDQGPPSAEAEPTPPDDDIPF